jgi:hypothetical protein
MDRNGKVVGGIYPAKSLLQLLRNDSCEILVLKYSLQGSYGEPIPMEAKYLRGQDRLIESYINGSTSRNGLNTQTIYRGVNIKYLTKYLKDGNRSWDGLAQNKNISVEYVNQ